MEAGGARIADASRDRDDCIRVCKAETRRFIKPAVRHYRHFMEQATFAPLHNMLLSAVDSVRAAEDFGKDFETIVAAVNQQRSVQNIVLNTNLICRHPTLLVNVIKIERSGFQTDYTHPIGSLRALHHVRASQGSITGSCHCWTMKLYCSWCKSWGNQRLHLSVSSQNSNTHSQSCLADHASEINRFSVTFLISSSHFF